MAPRLRPFWMVPALLTAGAVRIGAQNPTAACSQPTQVVQAQVDAFNHHDLEAFLATYAPDAELRVLPADSVLASGQTALRRAYDFLHHVPAEFGVDITERDRKSTRLNSSHSQISYAVFCLKKKKNNTTLYYKNIHRR